MKKEEKIVKSQESRAKSVKEKRYKKSVLRKTLEANMRARWRNELASEGISELASERKKIFEHVTVSPMEFSRWLKIYCEMNGLGEEMLKAKTLPESVVDAFGAWLGDPLR